MFHIVFTIYIINYINLFTDAILHTYPTTKEIEFEEIVAEWFRFAKQRRTRTTEKEKKKAERRKTTEAREKEANS